MNESKFFYKEKCTMHPNYNKKAEVNSMLLIKKCWLHEKTMIKSRNQDCMPFLHAYVNKLMHSKHKIRRTKSLFAPIKCQYWGK